MTTVSDQDEAASMLRKPMTTDSAADLLIPASMEIDADPVSPLSNPDANTGTAVLERPQTQEQSQDIDDGDADRFAHYVSKDRIIKSRLTGRPVVALCGKIWVPKHDPSQYPVCPDCKRIYDEMQRS
jgi:hypothetical protein